MPRTEGDRTGTFSVDLQFEHPYRLSCLKPAQRRNRQNWNSGHAHWAERWKAITSIKDILAIEEYSWMASTHQTGFKRECCALCLHPGETGKPSSLYLDFFGCVAACSCTAEMPVFSGTSTLPGPRIPHSTICNSEGTNHASDGRLLFRRHVKLFSVQHTYG